MREAVAWLEQQLDDALAADERAAAAPPSSAIATSPAAAMRSEFAALAARLRASR